MVAAGASSSFVLFEWTPSRRKEVAIPLGILPHDPQQNKCPYFLSTVQDRPSPQIFQNCTLMGSGGSLGQD